MDILVPDIIETALVAFYELYTEEGVL